MLSLLFVAALGSSSQVPPTLVVSNGAKGASISISGGALLHRSQGRILHERTISAGGGDTLALWDESTKRQTVPYYAIIENGTRVQRVTDTNYTIKLRYSEFDPLRSEPAVQPEFKAPADNDVYIVQFDAQPLESFREAIQSVGGTIYYYLAQHSYLVRMNAVAKQQVAAMPFVRWVGAYQPAYKLDPDLMARLQKGTLGIQRYNVQVYESGIAQKQNVANVVQILGGTPLDVTDQGYVMQADLTPLQLQQILALNDVFWVDLHSDLYADMNIARQIGGATYIESVAGYTGQGVRGQVRDLGMRATHQAYASRVMVRTNTTDTSHGTCTLGIVFGDGTGNSLGRGMLSLGTPIFLAGLTSGSTRYNETAGLLQAPYYGVFESNSTGGTLTGSYTTDSFGMDDILLHMDLIICQSMSNWGTNTSVRPQAWAKNIVSVGGIKHMDTLTKADDNWTSGASIGPAADGRIKPDLSHFYDNVLTTYYTGDTAYTTGFNGTSAATPITSGHFGLLYQMWADGVFGQTVRGSTVFDSRAQWPTMKALMVNTASQYPFTGTTADLTRTHQGWGLADVGSAYDHRGDMFIIDGSDVLQNLQIRTYRLFVPAGTPALRATLVYKDPPGTTSSTQHRINDLTLKVTDPSGATYYYGNNGLLAGNWSTSGGTANTKDTVENVFVQTPASGVWTVEVQANEVNADSHLETPEVDADYSLVVTGVVSAIAPSGYSANPGAWVSGGIAELATSNNQRMTLRPGLVLSAGSNGGPDLTVTGTAPTATLSELSFRVENSVSHTGFLTVSLYDYQAAAYVPIVTSVEGTLSDTANTWTTNDNPSRFVNPSTNEVRAKLHWDILALTSSQQSRIFVDQIRWLVTP